MTGFDSKRKMAQDKVAEPEQEPFGWYSAQEDEFMTNKLRKEHERLNSYTHIHGKFNLPLYTAPQQPEQEPLLALFDENQRLRAELKFNTVQQQEPRNFCPRCGKRRGGDVNYIHTCTPPRGLEMT